MTPTDASDTIQAASPVVSVIVPCYNYGRFLAGCVDSIFKSTSHPLEVIVIDDASTDETQAVTSNLARADARVRVFRHDVNWGHIATYNHGFSLVRGVYVHLISADDELAPGALDRAVAIIERIRRSDSSMVPWPGVSDRTSRCSGRAARPRTESCGARTGLRRGARTAETPLCRRKSQSASRSPSRRASYDARLPDLADLEM